MSARVTESQRLQDLFTMYNRRYFADRLPPDCPVKVTGARRHVHPDALGHLDLKTGIIVRPGPAETMRRVLLHEMAHLAIMMAVVAERLRQPRPRHDARQTTARYAPRGSAADANDHDTGWQREMWRLALDHRETWALIDISRNNADVAAVVGDMAAHLPPPNPTDDEEVCRRVVADCYEELRAAYLSRRRAA